MHDYDLAVLRVVEQGLWKRPSECMSSQIAKGIFRVIGNLRPGFLKVEYVSHADPLPPAPHGMWTYDMRDDLWIDEIPMDLVPIQARLPNSLLLVTVKEKTIVTDVSSA